MGVENMAAIPSASIELLRRLLGKRVTKLVRYSWWPKEEVAMECAIPDDLVFSLTAGPLAVIFDDGDVLGVSSDPALNSVVVWQDKVSGCQPTPQNAMETDPELFALPGNDERYSKPTWSHFFGLVVSGFTVLKRSLPTAREDAKPSEIGLRINFEDGSGFIASHGLHDGSDDFSVLDDSQIGWASDEVYEINLV